MYTVGAERDDTCQNICGGMNFHRFFADLPLMSLLIPPYCYEGCFLRKTLGRGPGEQEVSELNRFIFNSESGAQWQSIATSYVRGEGVEVEYSIVRSESFLRPTKPSTSVTDTFVA